MFIHMNISLYSSFRILSARNGRSISLFVCIPSALVFWSNYDGLQPCWSINVIIFDQPEHFSLEVGKHNPMIRVH